MILYRKTKLNCIENFILASISMLNTKNLNRFLLELRGLKFND